MNTRNSRGEQKAGRLHVAPASHESEYKAIHDQRLALIRSYNLWYAFGHAVAITYFAVLVNLSLAVASRPLMVAAAITASCIVWFAYHVVLSIDRGVVALYPRIVFLELMLDYDFYRDYLRRRPRGDTERSFIEKCEQIRADTADELWNQIYSHFDDKDFPGDRRITAEFKSAAYLAIGLFWIIIAVILAPLYFPWA